MALLSTPAVLLRTHAYSETSQILRFFSPEKGIVAAMAKGVRKRGGRLGGPLSTFNQGTLTVYHKEGRDLQTFKDFSAERSRLGLAKDPQRFSGASVLGELVLQHAEAEENPRLFHQLETALDALEATDPGELLSTLLSQIWTLIGGLGYAPSILSCVVCGRSLGAQEMGRFDFAEGGIRCPDCQIGVRGPRLGPTARSQLMALQSGSLKGGLLRPRAHLRLASDFITYHISGGVPLRSMEVLAKLLPRNHA